MTPKKETISFQQFKGSTEDFLKEIKVGPFDYSVMMGKLKGGKLFQYFWWEEEDKHHVNIADGTRYGSGKESVWVNSNNLPDYISFLESLGMKKLKIKTQNEISKV